MKLKEFIQIIIQTNFDDSKVLMHLKFKTIWKSQQKLDNKLIQNYSNNDALLDIFTYIDILQLYQMLKYNIKKS